LLGVLSFLLAFPTALSAIRAMVLDEAEGAHRGNDAVIAGEPVSAGEERQLLPLLVLHVRVRSSGDEVSTAHGPAYAEALLELFPLLRLEVARSGRGARARRLLECEDDLVLKDLVQAGQDLVHGLQRRSLASLLVSMPC
jgi:hypothetical protein